MSHRCSAAARVACGCVVAFALTACAQHGALGQTMPAPVAPVAPAAANPDAAAGLTAPSMLGEVRGLSSPESIVPAPGGGYLVSNTNGSAGAKKDNGFISHVRLDGTVDALHFIQGGRGGVRLDAPLGLALTGETLWVADVDHVRTFNALTGAPLRSYDLSRLGAKLLNGIGVSPDGSVYVTDTAVRLRGGKPHYVGPDHIYRIAGGRVSTALTGTTIRGPNGITWDADQHRFVVVSFMGNGVWGWDPASGALSRLATGPGKFDGVSVLPGGPVLVTSWADSSVHVVRSGALPILIRGVLPTPADMHLDPAHGRIMVPLSSQNRVDFWSLPTTR